MGEGGDTGFLGRRLRRPALAYITQSVNVIQVAVQSIQMTSNRCYVRLCMYVGRSTGSVSADKRLEAGNTLGFRDKLEGLQLAGTPL